MWKRKILSIAVTGALAAQASAYAAPKARSIRASELSANVWAELKKGEINELTIEFRQGDRLPVRIQAEGDFLESVGANTSDVGVKRNFWLRLRGDDVEMSLDGSRFSPLKDLLTGSLNASAGMDEPNGAASSIDVVLKAVLR